MSETGPEASAERQTARTPDEGAAPAPGPEPRTAPRPTPGKDPLRGSRTSGVWAAMVALVVLLVLLAVFVMQNTRSTEVAFFGWTVEVPLAAALLIATAAGMLIVVAAGSLRILQLRRRVRRERRR